MLNPSLHDKILDLFTLVAFVEEELIYIDGICRRETGHRWMAFVGEKLNMTLMITSVFWQVEIIV